MKFQTVLRRGLSLDAFQKTLNRLPVPAEMVGTVVGDLNTIPSLDK
ncbi:MAG: hypothetical protein QNJ27_00565 [Simkaniaceae bacterium]|nr:hypothetical protein [Simkaniaceae bacterium]